jgi:hypothetical protein
MVLSSLVGGSDYQEIIALNLDAFLMFGDMSRQQSFFVTILDDPLFELDEIFTLELQYDPFALDPPPSNLILRPDIATIEILDNDSKIGIT